MFCKLYYLGFLKLPFLFNIFINDLYLWVSKTDLLNFADNNTISAAEDTIKKINSTLKRDCQAAIDWFKINEMIVNPVKYPTTVV